MSSGPQNLRIKQIVKNYLENKDESEENEKKDEFIDYYGFYHQQALSDKQLKQEELRRENDIHRFHKWSKMVGKDGKIKHENNWSKYYRDGKSTEKLKRRVYKGIPNLARTIVWPLLLDVSQIKISHNRNSFNILFEVALKKSKFLEQIDLDINRTYRNTSFFVNRFGARQKSLFKLLAAYSVYNPEIGYCQGLSDIAGILLMYIHDDEDAFWAFCQLLNGPKHSMHGIFTNGFPGLERLFSHHEKVTSRLLPSLYKHLKNENVITTTYALKWFMQCFISRMPVSLTFRLWDIYLLEGEKLLIGQAYNILKMHKKTLLSMDACQIMTFLQDGLSKDFSYSDDDVIDSLKECLEILHKNRLDVLPALTAEMLPKEPLGLELSNYKSDIWESKKSDQVHHTLTHSTKGYHTDLSTGDRPLPKQSQSAYNTIDGQNSKNRKIDSRYSERNAKELQYNSYYEGDIQDNPSPTELHHHIINENQAKNQQKQHQEESIVTNFSTNQPDTGPLVNQNKDDEGNEKSLSVILNNGVTNPLFPGPISPPLSDTCSSINPESTRDTPSVHPITVKKVDPVNSSRQMNSISGVPRQFDYSSSSLKRNSNRSLESNYSQLMTSSPEKRIITSTGASSPQSSLPRRDLNAEHQARTYVIASVLCDSVERRVNQSYGQPLISSAQSEAFSLSPEHKSNTQISPDTANEKSNSNGVWIQREFDQQLVNNNNNITSTPSDNIQIPQQDSTPTISQSNNSNSEQLLSQRIPLVYDISQITSIMNSPNSNSKCEKNNRSLSQSPHTPTSRTMHKATIETKNSLTKIFSNHKNNNNNNRFSYQPTVGVDSLDRNSSSFSPNNSKIKSLTNLENYPIDKSKFEKRTFIIDSEQIDHLIEKTFSK